MAMLKMLMMTVHCKLAPEVTPNSVHLLTGSRSNISGYFGVCTWCYSLP